MTNFFKKAKAMQQEILTRKGFKKGYLFAAEVLLKSGAFKKLETEIELRKTHGDYYPFEQGMERAIFDYQQRLRGVVVTTSVKLFNTKD